MASAVPMATVAARCRPPSSEPTGPIVLAVDIGGTKLAAGDRRRPTGASSAEARVPPRPRPTPRPSSRALAGIVTERVLDRGAVAPGGLRCRVRRADVESAARR